MTSSMMSVCCLSLQGLFGYVNECPEEDITFRVEIRYVDSVSAVTL